jgi:gamma-glutamylcyclotransferase (GGCT)/AIG2-like uncharacterized protein YtfP
VQRATFGRLLKGEADELVGFEQSLIRITDEQTIKLSGRADHVIVRFNGRNESRVRGTVFEITDSELEKADRYEVAEYTRISTVLASGKTAWVYADASAPTAPDP